MAMRDMVSAGSAVLRLDVQDALFGAPPEFVDFSVGFVFYCNEEVEVVIFSLFLTKPNFIL